MSQKLIGQCKFVLKCDWSVGFDLKIYWSNLLRHFFSRCDEGVKTAYTKTLNSLKNISFYNFNTEER